MMNVPGGQSTNTNTNNIKIDLGDIAGKKEDKAKIYAVLTNLHDEFP